MVIMKQNIKLLIESLFDDVDIFDDDDTTILMDSYERISKSAIEDLKQGKMVSKGVLNLCHEKPYQWKPSNIFELKQVIHKIESDKSIKVFDLNWVDVSDFDSLSQLFSMCKKNYDISEWDVSNVKSMSWTFYGCYNFNCDLSNWKTPKLRNMRYTFWGCKTFNSDISGWDVSNVEDMCGTFCACDSFNAPIGKWKVSNVKDFNNFLFGADNFNQDLSSWDLRHIFKLDNMFYGTLIYKKPAMKPRVITDQDYIDLCKQYFEFYPKCEWDLDYDDGYIEYKDYDNPEDSDGYSIYRILIEFGDTIDDYEIEINAEDPENYKDDQWVGLNKLSLSCIQELYYELKKHLNRNFTKINDDEDE